MNYAEKIKELFFVSTYYAEQQEDAQFRTARYGKKDKEINNKTINTAITEDARAIGVYTTSKDEKCKWIVLDFDLKTKDGIDNQKLLHFREGVLEYYKRCLNYGVTPYLEFSGFKGYHIWIFTGLIDSELAFKVSKVLGKDIKGETFPRQANLKSHDLEYGNLVKLPHCINRKSGKRSVWLNPNFTPVKNQLEFFSSIKITPINILNKIAEEFSGDLIQKIELKPISPNTNIDISKYPITKEKPRHEAQFPLIMRCMAAGYDDSKILEIGRDWLTMYRDKFNSPISVALKDYKAGMRYCRVKYCSGETA